MNAEKAARPTSIRALKLDTSRQLTSHFTPGYVTSTSTNFYSMPVYFLTFRPGALLRTTGRNIISPHKKVPEEF